MRPAERDRQIAWAGKLTQIGKKALAALLVAALLAAIAVFALTYSGTIGRRGPATADAEFIAVGATVKVVDYSALVGWHADRVDESLPALLRSCEKMSVLPPDSPVNPAELLGVGAPPGATLAGVASDWAKPCEEAARVLSFRYADENARSSAAKSFYEYYFTPVKLFTWKVPNAAAAATGVAPRADPIGRFTGYFEPFYEASPSRTAVFSAPLYARPDDLVTVDLGLFRQELAGQRIAGRVINGVLRPYPDHAEINAGAISSRARVLAWMRPTDLFFLQIQGSGKLSLPDSDIRVGYDGANGRPYTAIGRTLVDMGALTPENVSMQSIRTWLENAKDIDAQAVRESNESFVFFKVLENLHDPNLGPLGAQGVQLTPGRSLAVDPRYVGYGVPVWISIDGNPEKHKEPVRRLMIAQDTGGAIKGPVRGDIFVGSGPLAGEVAGDFNEMGEMIILIPNGVARQLAATLRP